MGKGKGKSRERSSPFSLDFSLQPPSSQVVPGRIPAVPDLPPPPKASSRSPLPSTFTPRHDPSTSSAPFPPHIGDGAGAQHKDAPGRCEVDSGRLRHCSGAPPPPSGAGFPSPQLPSSSLPQTGSPSGPNPPRTGDGSAAQTLDASACCSPNGISGCPASSQTEQQPSSPVLGLLRPSPGPPPGRNFTSTPSSSLPCSSLSSSPSNALPNTPLLTPVLLLLQSLSPPAPVDHGLLTTAARGMDQSSSHEDTPSSASEPAAPSPRARDLFFQISAMVLSPHQQGLSASLCGELQQLTPVEAEVLNGLLSSFQRQCPQVRDALASRAPGLLGTSPRASDSQITAAAANGHQPPPRPSSVVLEPSPPPQEPSRPSPTSPRSSPPANTSLPAGFCTATAVQSTAGKDCTAAVLQHPHVPSFARSNPSDPSLPNFEFGPSPFPSNQPSCAPASSHPTLADSAPFVRTRFPRRTPSPHNGKGILPTPPLPPLTHAWPLPAPMPGFAYFLCLLPTRRAAPRRRRRRSRRRRAPPQPTSPVAPPTSDTTTPSASPSPPPPPATTTPDPSLSTISTPMPSTDVISSPSVASVDTSQISPMREQSPETARPPTSGSRSAAQTSTAARTPSAGSHPTFSEVVSRRIVADLVASAPRRLGPVPSRYTPPQTRSRSRLC